MSDDLFDGPGSADQLDLDAIEGNLLLVKPIQQLSGINTAFGAKDAVEADVHILDGPQGGEVLRGAYIFPLVLQGQVKGNVGTGRFNLGRVGKGTPKPGQKPPWKMLDPTESDRDLARRYIASDKYKENSAAPVAEPAAVSAAGAGAAPTDPWGSNNDQPPF